MNGVVPVDREGKIGQLGFCREEWTKSERLVFAWYCQPSVMDGIFLDTCPGFLPEMRH